MKRAALGLGQRSRAGPVLVVARGGLEILRREVAVQVDTSGILARVSFVAVGIGERNDDQMDVGRNELWFTVEQLDELGGREDGCGFVAVDAGEEEDGLSRAVAAAVIAPDDRTILQRVADDVAGRRGNTGKDRLG